MKATRIEPLPQPFTFPRCGGHFNVSTGFHPRSTLLATAGVEPGKVVILGLTSDVPIPVAEFQSVPLALSFDESGDYLSVLESDRITTWNISNVEHLSQQSVMELDAELVGGYAWAEMIESNKFPWNLRPSPLASPVSLSDVTRIFTSKFIGERTLWSTQSARARQLMITYDENAENNAMPTVSVVDQITLEVLRSISFSEWKNVVVSSDGSLMAVALPQDTSTEIWDLRKGTIVAKVDCPQMHKSQFSSDNRYLLSVVPDLSGYANLKCIDLIPNCECKTLTVL